MLVEINHLSASHINTFITNRPKWFARYFRDMKFTPNLFVNRGHAVEEGVVNYLTNGTRNITDAIAAAMKKYDELLVGLVDNLEIRQSIGPLVSTLITGNDDYAGYEELLISQGVPKTQEPIKIFLDGCSIPVIGYIDFLFKKCVIDNKAVKKTPRSLSQDYILQGSLYRKATGLPVRFMYGIAGKKPSIKIITLSDEEYEFGIKLATQAAQAIERIIETPLDGGLLEALMFPDPSGGYGGSEQQEVCKILGFDDIRASVESSD